MKLKSLLFLTIVCLAFAGCNANDLNNGGSDSSMMDSSVADSVNMDSPATKPASVIDSTRLEAPVH